MFPKRVTVELISLAALGVLFGVYWLFVHTHSQAMRKAWYWSVGTQLDGRARGVRERLRKTERFTFRVTPCAKYTWLQSRRS
jgi:hypothetical protein